MKIKEELNTDLKVILKEVIAKFEQENNVEVIVTRGNEYNSYVTKQREFHLEVAIRNKNEN